ncbi:MAG: helix-turn-helix domain-containing protein [Patescibacteria group bacterium]|nr:helix-turn-helix domain-containing protein [Patescibacteria group bacterium]
MTIGCDEETYPVSFREEETKLLGAHLRSRDSVELIGMKRVGISNFLRYFLHHPHITATYISTEQRHIFIPVDLNDLIETELFPFWRLTLKRIVDVINMNDDLEPIRKRANDEFLKSIQIPDLFFTVDTVRHILIDMVRGNYMPTIFFIRFDRLQEVVTPELFSNLQGIVDSTNRKTCYVFTGSRELHTISPTVFQKQDLAAFAHKIYLKPASPDDMQIIRRTLMDKYRMQIDEETGTAIVENCGGHVQLLQLSLIIVNELLQKSKRLPADYIRIISDEERVVLQCEELYATLTAAEQHALLKIFHGETLHETELQNARYLYNTGYIQTNGTQHVFSPFFGMYLQNMEVNHKKEKVNLGLTKKEQMLYNTLKEHIGEICERENIIQAVWPECNEIGVSDWALDRLVSRLRGKLKLQKVHEEIQTVKTRGFRLISSE